MRNIVLFSLICISFTSCIDFRPRIKGNGVVASEIRNVGRVTKLRVSGPVDVVIGSGASGIRVEAEENIPPYIITKSKGEWLEVKTKNNIGLSTHRPMIVHLSTPYLSAIKVRGSGNISGEKKVWSQDELEIDVQGSGDVTIEVNAPRVDTDISGSGNVTLMGETRDVKVSIQGSGNYKGKELKAENAKVTIAGSGEAYVFADVKLDAKIMGSGNINYVGHGNVDKSVAGSGSVRKMD